GGARARSEETDRARPWSLRLPIAALALATFGCSALNSFGVPNKTGRYGPSPTPTPTPLPTPVPAPAARNPPAAPPLAPAAPAYPATAESVPEAAPAQAPVVGQPLDHIVASVDGDPITLREVHQFAAQSGHPFDGDDLAASDTGKAALKAM